MIQYTLVISHVIWWNGNSTRWCGQSASNYLLCGFHSIATNLVELLWMYRGLITFPPTLPFKFWMLSLASECVMGRKWWYKYHFKWTVNHLRPKPNSAWDIEINEVDTISPNKTFSMHSSGIKLKTSCVRDSTICQVYHAKSKSSNQRCINSITLFLSC